jgi:hypothetical protein
MENGALDFKGKMVFLEGSRGICGIFSGWKLWHERTELLRCLEKIWGFLVDFWSV